jgi:hypothetical protein
MSIADCILKRNPSASTSSVGLSSVIAGLSSSKALGSISDLESERVSDIESRLVSESVVISDFLYSGCMVSCFLIQNGLHLCLRILEKNKIGS